MKDQPFDVLMSNWRNPLDWEAEKAEVMFKKFLSDGFVYDDISNRPDYPIFASAEMISIMLPQMIDEMFRRNDFGNYMIYPMVSALDPEAKGMSDHYRDRTKKLIALADKTFTEKAYHFLIALEPEPPIPEEDFNKILAFWQNYLQSF